MTHSIFFTDKQKTIMTETEANVQTYFQKLGKNARIASKIIAIAEPKKKNQALINTAENLQKARTAIKAANELDLEAANQNKLSSALLDRLELSDKHIDTMTDSLYQVAQLSDPIGAITDLTMRPSGIQVGRMRVPLGVVGIIYESRPNVTTEAASLCIKSGNAVLLRGGSEAIRSNQSIADCLTQGLQAAGLPTTCIQIAQTTDRTLVDHMIHAPEFIDVIIPRGGKGLISKISQGASVPIIKHLEGNCHIYVDNPVNQNSAHDVIINAKTQRLGTCNTLESLLIHQDLPPSFLNKLASTLNQHNIEIRGCERTCQILSSIKAATEEDWYTEYLGPVLSIKIMDNLTQAIEHINQYGSHHTDTILTDQYENALQFLRATDSSSVMVNTSTRFADGYEYGLGAEVGISTDKLHVRGPVGLEGLTTQKFIVLGNGQLRP